ncbi:hypothetical protein [Ruegeria arenilitoris]|uniref:hypothetical protein n=1 Tax=Ruegeria arenilitoris TaxID=1173585 RepID=UPI00147B237A|nr:hypothetical protein [Ruegeria arenilitoris]
MDIEQSADRQAVCCACFPERLGAENLSYLIWSGGKAQRETRARARLTYLFPMRLKQKNGFHAQSAQTFRFSA